MEANVLFTQAVENCPPPKIDLRRRSKFATLLKSIYGKARLQKSGRGPPRLMTPSPIEAHLSPKSGRTI
jgi:hypothetical protein